jgi:hypothetical protein
VEYAYHLEQRRAGASPVDREHLVSKVRQVDNAIQPMLDRLVELQFTRDEAASRFNNDRFTGAFPNRVEGDDGNMGSWDIEGWAPPMLSLDQYDSVRALAKGYGRFHRVSYNNAAAAGARQLLSTRDIDPDLIYAGSPPGFPLDGAAFLAGEESGEHLYLVTYGWSPNAIAQLGTVLKALRDNRVTVPRSPAWLRLHWRGEPPQAVLDRRSFWRHLDTKLTYTHAFLEATQLPVPSDFPWIDLARTSFPGPGTEEIRRGGWYDGSGRGAMSAVYARIAVDGYVASGGDNATMLRRASQWWDRMLVWRSSATTPVRETHQ